MERNWFGNWFSEWIGRWWGGEGEAPPVVETAPDWGSAPVRREYREVKREEPEVIEPVLGWVASKQAAQLGGGSVVNVQMVRGEVVAASAAASGVAKGNVSYDARNERELSELLFLNAA